MLFNNREWPSFALAAGNFLKTVPKPPEASTCAGTQAPEWRRGGLGVGRQPQMPWNQGKEALGWDPALPAPSHCLRPPGPGLMEGKAVGHVLEGLGTGQGGCSFLVGRRGRIQVAPLPPANQFGCPRLGSQGRNQARLQPGRLAFPNA